ncbi:hypothetical protein DFH27DRAFT_556461 [Peziza echinospora]|nr:hypothetical protein DFH27DRAFT_556461 [Peziza echinospora]
MGGINEKEMPETNWLWFRVFANLGLSKVGLPHNPARMLKDLDHLDTFYLGDGWSRDGPVGVRQLDYYSGSFAIQYAQLVYSRLAAASDPARSKEYKQRAAAFAVDFLRYYDPHTGAAIPFGRSTTYRMAMGAFWAALAWAFTPEDYAALLPAALADPGVVKGLLLRSLRWWAAHHATIFAGDGTLTIGYVYPNMHFTENYNSPGSPYWATKAFLVLGMPATAPFWAAAEKPFPAFGAIGGRVRRIAHPLHISVHAPRHTYLLSTGQACHYPLKATQAKYGKFSYSARFGFCVPTGSYMLDQHALDGMLGFSADGGETWRSRRIVEGPGFESYTAPGGGDWPVLTGTWDVFGDGDARLTTWLVPPSGGESHYHLRVHKLVILPNSGKGKGFGGKILSAEGGWAVYGQGEDGRTLAPYTRASNEGRENGDGYAFAVSSGGVVGVREIVPTAAKRTSEVLNVDANASLIWPRTVLPTLRGEHDAVKGGVEWFVTAIYGRATREDEDGYEGDSVDGGKKRKRGSEEPEEREREREWESEWREVDGNGWHKLLPEELRVQVMLATV